ncbi:MAG: hypothetical protein ACOY4R_27880 [Pseudomonadota bacterium]
MADNMGVPFDGVWKQADLRDALMVAARAAIEAMREPTEALIDAGRAATAAHLDIKGSGLTVAREKMRRRFNAMLDAALQETESWPVNS